MLHPIKCIALGLLLTVPSGIRAQRDTAAEHGWVDSVLLLLGTDQTLDVRTKSDLADSAFHISQSLHDTCQQVLALAVQASFLDAMAMSDSALTQLYRVSSLNSGGCDSAQIVMSFFASLTNVYLSLNEFDRIDSVSRIALQHWNPAWKNKETRFIILNNLGIARFYADDTASAMAIFHQVYDEAALNNNVKYIQQALLNLGSINGAIGRLDSAAYFLNAAALQARKNEDVDNLMHLLINLANLDGERGDYHGAAVLLDSAYQMAEARGNTDLMAGAQNARADLYAQMHQYKNAYDYLREYTEVREKYLDDEKVKAVADMMEKYQSEKKARQIQQLKVEKLDADLKNERVTSTRNRLMYGGIVVLLIAAGLWSRLRYVRRSRATLQKEKDISEGLLLNILPESVAAELKEKGYADAKYYDATTILFSDFKSFTSISEQLNATDLVTEINVCFKAFDEIMTQFGIEKIKTIGDAYMAAGGLTETGDGSGDPGRTGHAAICAPPEAGTGCAESARLRNAHRYPHRTSSCRDRRSQKIPIRPLGRYCQYRQPDGKQ